MKPIPNNIAAQMMALSRVSKSIGSIGSSLTFGPTNISVILESIMISVWSERLGPSTKDTIQVMAFCTYNFLLRSTLRNWNILKNWSEKDESLMQKYNKITNKDIAFS